MNSKIIIYQSGKGAPELQVKLGNDTVWLTRAQLAELFGRDIKTIGKHVNNALSEELDGISVVAKFATTAADGKTYQTEHYNLDMILSVGYRVKSSEGVKFLLEENKLGKVLFPARKKASSLYRNLEPKYFDSLDSPELKNKIGYKK